MLKLQQHYSIQSKSKPKQARDMCKGMDPISGVPCPRDIMMMACANLDRLRISGERVDIKGSSQLSLKVIPPLYNKCQQSFLLYLLF